jgi:hypothetical protein
LKINCNFENQSTLCGAPKKLEQINVESVFLFPRICPVLQTFFLLSQILIKIVSSGWLASKNQVGIGELPALKYPVQVSIPFGDSCSFFVSD